MFFTTGFSEDDFSKVFFARFPDGCSPNIGTSYFRPKSVQTSFCTDWTYKLVLSMIRCPLGPSLDRCVYIFCETQPASVFFLILGGAKILARISLDFGVVQIAG